MRSLRTVAILIYSLLAGSACASTDALVQICRIWSAVKFLDPQLLTRSMDWDASLVRAIPAARAAKTPDEAAAAIALMLQDLHDPATRIVRDQHGTSEGKLFEWQDDVLVVNIGPYADAVSNEAELFSVPDAIAPELAKARAVVFDLRTKHTETPGWIFDRAALVEHAVPVPARQSVFRSGYAPQFPFEWADFYSAVQIVASPSIAAAPANTHVPSRVVIITGDEVPFRAAALWWSGKAAIVSRRQISSQDVVETKRIALDDGWSAFIRVKEMVANGLTADAVAEDRSAVETALELARSKAPLSPRPALRETPAAPITEHDATFADMTAPDVSYRLLSLFRLWSVIDRFYPYKTLIGDWDAVLREFIPRFEEAVGADAYARTVLELAARVEDGHTQVWGPAAVWDVIGTRFLPMEVRPIEDRFLVTAKRQALPAGVGVAVGDEIVSVDGEPLRDRVRRLWKYVTASTDAARLAAVTNFALRGARNSVAELGVRGADGELRTVQVARTQMSALIDDRPVWRVLPGNIGYIDLTRLTPPDIDEAFDAIGRTKALIFDMRGYPNGTAWSIAPRINTRNAVVGALFSRIEISVATFDQSNTRYAFEQRIASTDKPKYTGRTVMLIDDRALSQAEQAGLWFEAASGTRFVGSNSAGANGDTTNLVLPGGIYVAFTGHEIRHADGRQLQRIGIVPDVRVTPTIRGIREGKDEVLDRALSFLESDDS